MYQGAPINYLNEALLKSCKDQALADLFKLTEREAVIKRLELSDVPFLRAILAFLNTQTWCQASSDTAESEL